MTEKLLIENRGAVRLLTINRPEKHNCVDGEVAVAIGEGIEAFANDDEARVLVVTGAGSVSFCAGADLKGTASLRSHRYRDSAGPMGFARLDPGKPTIAAINGYCFAGGFELAAWCDFRIASANAEFGCLSRRWGVPYVDGGTQRFARIMGLGNALYLLETGMRIDANRAYAMGFLQEIVAEGEVLGRALTLAPKVTRPALDDAEGESSGPPRPPVANTTVAMTRSPPIARIRDRMGELMFTGAGLRLRWLARRALRGVTTYETASRRKVSARAGSLEISARPRAWRRP